MSDVRSLSVPDGLEGERVDAALARLFGLSRTKAADLATAGAVTVDQRTVGKADRVIAGAWLEVSLPEPNTPTRLELVAEPVPGMAVVHDDDDVVVVDKPVGVAAHPSVGWTGPNARRARDLADNVARVHSHQLLGHEVSLDSSASA